ncbi:M15 family metallopeptidase [uncultured Desulfovibrio sp.]|uniref:M15 family metallopeptidase n=1 Tax=uncultured Desulfovibrio sp. TaxID=167968 RepID=UPI00263469BA|nr:M15 family metallopeptidase [uncultured Desulfovibrio sp.]
MPTVRLAAAALLISLCTPQSGLAGATSFSDDTSGFVMLTDAVPDAVLEMRYYSTYNFVGERIAGYEEPCALLTKEAAQALKAASDEFASRGYRLKIYDAYRPQAAVAHFRRWAGSPDTRMKRPFYPRLNKSELFARGYIATRSGHSRGSTVDLTLLDRKTGRELDMGGSFDLFDSVSRSDYTRLSAKQLHNRKLLRDVMIRHGFKPYRGEWWHFTLAKEPYPKTYFTFPVKQLPQTAGSLPAAQIAQLRAARQTNQLVITSIDDAGATLALYEKQGGAWRRILAVPAYIGKNGLGKTAEGDKKTPTGRYRFTMAFGIAPDPGSRMPYTQVGREHYWVGDSASPLYNRFASSEDGTFDRQQSERLIDYEKPYQYCLNISYNEEGTPGKGSAIFLHCYSDNSYTEGCIAIPEDAMKRILRRVDKDCVLLIDRRENLQTY